MPTNKEIEAAIDAAKKIIPLTSSTRRIGENGLRNPDEFVKAILEAAEKARWQPIEEAPKDGTLILLCGGITSEDGYCGEVRNKANRPVTAFYDGEYWCVGYWDSDWRTVYEEPTHFQPLPTMEKEDD